MFDIAEPAASIFDLIDYLKQQHQSGDLYRGETKDHVAIVPSIFRKCVVNSEIPRDRIEIDASVFADLLQNSVQFRLRYQVLNALIGHFGIGLGNIIAQQYGLSSECIDVTEDIHIAAFFATRRWPSYEHYHGDGELGVIYRYREDESALSPSTGTRAALDSWFEMGECDGAYFDFFLREDQYHHCFDRDKWLGAIPGKRAKVSTLPLTMPWTDIRSYLTGGRGSEAIDEQLHKLFGPSLKFNRTMQQAGGFIRPRYYWQADIPEHYSLWRKGMHRPTKHRSLLLGFEDNSTPTWPKYVPSLAIKRAMVEIENIKSRSGLQTFYFRHSDKRITGLYRRELWPEPSEDRVYQYVWQQAQIVLISNYLNDDVPAVDDPEHGLLDRGYRRVDDKKTKDARDLDDLMQAQLEDAEEAFKFGSPTAKDYRFRVGALTNLNDVEKAKSCLVEGLEKFPTDVGLLLTASAIYTLVGVGTTADEHFEHARQLEPDHPEVRFVLAARAFKCRDYARAAENLNVAIQSLEQLVTFEFTPMYELVGSRGIVAGLLNDSEGLEKIKEQYSQLGYDPSFIFERIEEFRIQHMRPLDK